MVSIHSQTENDYVKSIINTNGEYWLGGMQVANRLKSFTWIDGTPFDFNKWGSNQPNDEEIFACLAIVTQSKGFWGDRSCGNRYGQLCQISASSENALFDAYPNHFINGLTKNHFKLLKLIKHFESELIDNGEKLNALQSEFEFRSRGMKKQLKTFEAVTRKMFSLENRFHSLNASFLSAINDIDSKYETQQKKCNKSDLHTHCRASSRLFLTKI
ncbi:galactose-specific lectin nattectin-like protein [Dinothrombium tinctorium]|uniref:Galactose-specific lectin nattectin-like protein n=1 Tax=Dinothrombium tinctorium TaxID=1965070 RepID=A0A3S3NZS2_9ACAR|nr:galactose-specific lectin nattectin-like protein [Dinothrombium tinctorium]